MGSLSVGQEVRVGDGKAAVVVALGPCGWEKCTAGDDCVTVLEEGRSTTTNWHATRVR